MSEEADKVKSKRPSRSEILSRGIDKCISLCTDQLDMSKRKNDFESLQLTEREKETLTKGFMEKKAAAIEKLTEGDRKWRRTGDPEMDLRPLQYKLLFDYVTNLDYIHEDLKKSIASADLAKKEQNS
ncbi:hypothetical protein T4C_1856 [Trichinella pseudospiralis]|uniref:Uncharacterized protein n=1 Tax=Trichinella pseudospiralis TaxID=6337 RepID=A0A0V1K0L5_TRIPS|nr:hypothetical protein T4C_1856 [Trichinella pseudospiralis]